MGLLQRLSTTVMAPRLRAGPAYDAMSRAFWAGEPVAWFDQLVSAGMSVTPELSMTLSAMYGGVTTIAYDLATLPAEIFRERSDGGKDRIEPTLRSLGENGVPHLAYLLRWQPNAFQTATEFMIGQVAQYLLRGVAYAEIVTGVGGFVDQLLPRHPDRVRAERLPSGRLRYELTEANGTRRYVTQAEMFVVRDLSLDGGLTTTSRTAYGANAIANALAADAAAGKFFRSGMTAAKVATYEGEMDREDEEQLHASITRFATGVENNFGLMLVPDKVTVTNLGIEPEKAQMIQSREWGIREIARQLRIPGYKLGIRDSVAYASQVQAAIDYVISCLRPIAVAFEQAIQRDLVLDKNRYFALYRLDALLRGDPDAQSAFIERLIKVRVLRPSEARIMLNMNPDPELDRLSEMDFRPGTPRNTVENGRADNRLLLRGMLAIHDAATRCVRRERVAVEKLARKHADDPAAWRQGLQAFYADHAGFISDTLRIDPRVAQGYAAQHGSAFEARGLPIIEGEAGAAWERYEADSLAALAVDGEGQAA